VEIPSTLELTAATPGINGMRIEAEMEGVRIWLGSLSIASPGGHRAYHTANKDVQELLSPSSHK